MLRVFFFSLRSEDYFLITRCTDDGSLPEAAFSDLISCLGGDISDYTFTAVKSLASLKFRVRSDVFSLADTNVRPFILIPVTRSSP